LESNKEAPYHYRCEKPWIQAMTSSSFKCKSPSTETTTPPKKNKKASQAIIASPLADTPTPTAHSTPTPAIRSTPTPAACSTPQSPEGSSPQGAETLTVYMLRHLAFKEQALELLEHSNEEIVLEVEAL
jgi:hypothetical protein